MQSSPPTPQSPPAKGNRGVAVVLALVILVGLLLLGLPLLFSMTMARSGTASFKAQVSAHEALQSAEDLAVGIGQIGTSAHLSNPDRRYSILDLDLNDVFAPKSIAICDSAMPNRFDINLGEIGLSNTSSSTKGSTLLGLTIEDEGGKIDVNDMNTQMWDDLVGSLGISLSGGKTATLANYRFYKWFAKKDQFITSLDELLVEPPLAIAGSRKRKTPQQLLSPEQLNLLRPFITAHGRAQGRERMIDIGTLMSMQKTVVLNIRDSQPPPLGLWPAPASAAYIVAEYNGGQRQIRGKNQNGDWPNLVFYWSTSNLSLIASAWWMDSDGNTITPPGIVDFPSSDPARRGDHTECRFDAPVADLLGPGCVLVFHRRSDGRSDARTLRIRLDTDYGFWNSSATIANFATDLSNPENVSDNLLNAFGSGYLQWPASVEVPHAINVNHAPDLVCKIVSNGVMSRNSLLYPLPPISATDLVLLGRSPTDCDTGFSLLHSLRLTLDPDTGSDTSRLYRSPLDIRSWGTYRYQARSTAGDVRERPLMSRSVSGIVQCPPATSAFIRIPPRQADWELLRRKGQLGRFATGPWATIRYQLNSDPNLPIGNYWTLTNLEDSGGAVPNPIDTWFASTTNQRIFPPNSSLASPSLLLPFRAPQAARDSIGKSYGVGGNQTPLSGTIAVAQLAVDGVTFASGLQYDTATVLPVKTGIVNDLQEARSRQIAFWIKPRTAWNTNSASIALLDMTAPGNACHPEYTNPNGQGNPAFQNRWRLEFDKGFLVLTLAGPTIEHTSPSSRVGTVLHAPQDNPATLFANEESLGTTSTVINLTPRHKMNNAKFYYWVGTLEADHWYQIQAGVAHDHPGGQFISLDGIVGRGPEALDTSAPPRLGDHCILPSVRLKKAMENLSVPTIRDDSVYGDALSKDSSTGDTTMEFELTSIHKQLGYSSASDILPERGQVRIGNEFIAYETLPNDITGAYLRSRRANTNVASGNVSETYPIMEAHPAGSMVYPAGYRYKPSGGKLHQGKTTTTQNFLNGDPNPPAEYNSAPSGPLARHGTVWGRVGSEDADHDTDHLVTRLNLQDPMNTHSTDALCTAAGHTQKCVKSIVVNHIPFDYRIDGGTPITIPPITRLTLTTEPTHLDHAYMPPTTASAGLIRIQTRDGSKDQYWHHQFSYSATKTFLNLTPVHAELGRGASVILYPQSSTTAAPLAWCLSLATRPDIDIGDPNVFEPSDNLIQIESTGNGRIEWMKYDAIVRDLTPITTDRFFVSWDGWRRPVRGQQRTVYAGDLLPGSTTTRWHTKIPTSTTLDDNASVFGPSSIILPVQRRLNNSHMLATGDVVTLIDDTAQSASQMAIRFAATDGYRNATNFMEPAPIGSGVTTADVRNEFFTFTDEVPTYFTTAATTMTILCGRGWSGLDLNPLNPITLKRGCMPLPSRSATATTLFAGGIGTAWFDSVLVTDQPGDLVGSTAIGQMESILKLPGNTYGGTWQESFTLDPDDLGCLIKIDSYQCVRQYRGLLHLGSEVIAYDQDELLRNPSPGSTNREPGPWSSTLSYPRGSGNWVRVIGRGLLGSTKQTHTVTVTSGNRRSGPAVIPLPFGPVEYMPEKLTSLLAPIYNGSFSLSNTLAAHPAILAVWPLGQETGGITQDTKVEFITATGYHITPWMRGLYGSEIADWSTEINGANWRKIQYDEKGLRPLLIGWWPRWPSALPKNKPASFNDQDWSAGQRSRFYLSTSFPMRMDGMTDLVLNSTLPSDPGNFFELHSNILRQGFDCPTLPSFTGPYDGMECKVTWHYKNQSSTSTFLDLIKILNNTPPGISDIELEAKAPCIRYEHSDAR